MKLSKTQQEVLSKLSKTEWKSAYDLRCGLNTLQSLATKGLVKSKSGLGSMAFPRTNIKFKLI
ncbi:MAG: hypothetical protein KAS32_24240 [Candidatus Peribacteraceae bacterium]|nr:hypothetical protein [Candidatus Peribacteraceae bacterium]